MADEIDLSKVDDITDEAELQKTLARLRGEPAEPPAEPKPAEVIVEPEGAGPALVVEPEPKLAAEVKPETPAPKPAAEDDDAVVVRANRLGKRVRLLEQELAEARAAREQQPPAATADAPKPPAYQDDPAEYLKARTDNLQSELERLRNEQANKDRLDGIRTREAEFERAKPDYRDALKHLESAEVQEWEKSGLAVAGMRQLSQAVAAGKRGDAAFKPYADHVANIAKRPDIVELAAKESRDADEVAMYMVARDTYLTSRRQMVWQGAEATGRNPAEIAYELAQARGYTAAPPTAVAEPAPRVDPNLARQQVLQAKAISEAANSLSETASAEGAPQPRVLRNRNDVLSLPDDQLDALIMSGRYKDL